jgi:hypothetical protein
MWKSAKRMVGQTAIFIITENFNAHRQPDDGRCFRLKTAKDK